MERPQYRPGPAAPAVIVVIQHFAVDFFAEGKGQASITARTLPNPLEHASFLWQRVLVVVASRAMPSSPYWLACRSLFATEKKTKQFSLSPHSIASGQLIMALGSHVTRGGNTTQMSITTKIIAMNGITPR